MASDVAPGFDVGTIAGDVPVSVDDEPVAVVELPDADAEPAEAGRRQGEGESLDESLRLPAATSAVDSLRGLLQGVPAAAAGGPSPPRSGATFRVIDSVGSSADALDVIANPVAPGTYLGVYHISVGGGRFALALGSSRDLRTWRKLGALDAGGGAMGALRALPGGGFLLAYEAQGPTQPNGKIATNVRLRYYRDGAALLAGRATEQRSLPRRLSPTNEGTPDLRNVSWRGSLARSTISLGFHWLDHGPKLPVDRQARGTLDAGRWTVTVERNIDRALSTRGFHGNHGARRQFRFPKGGKAWRIYEAQKAVNVTGSWRVFLYDVEARTLAQLRVRTPRGSQSFANPTAAVLPSPAGGDALVVTMFIFGAGSGSGESGELVFYHDL